MSADAPVVSTPSAATSGQLPDAGSNAGITILVVDDDHSVRRMMLQALELCGFSVLGAADAEQALQVVEESDGSIDLLISDIVMPGSSGAELYRMLRTRIPGLRVILMSGYPVDPLKLGDSVEAPPFFLQKPFRIENLMEAIRTLMDAEHPGQVMP